MRLERAELVELIPLLDVLVGADGERKERLASEFVRCRPFRGHEFLIANDLSLLVAVPSLVRIADPIPRADRRFARVVMKRTEPGALILSAVLSS